MMLGIIRVPFTDTYVVSLHVITNYYLQLTLARVQVNSGNIYKRNKLVNYHNRDVK